MRALINKKYRIYIGIAVIMGALVVLGYAAADLFAPMSVRIASAATRALASCTSSEYRPACYDKAIPSVTKSFTMEQAFLVTRKVQEKDSAYAYCHVLGHELAARETKKDPSRWMDVITRCPSGVCSNGCIHGAFQERFRQDRLSVSEVGALKPDLMRVCEPRGGWHPTDMERASCYHALGHLLMYVTGADPAASVALCGEIGNRGNDGDFRRVCEDGVFMQMYQPLEPEDFALIAGKAPTQATHRAFCAPFWGTFAWISCWAEGWPLYRGVFEQPSGLVWFCSQVPETDRAHCMSSMLYVMVAQLRFQKEAIAQYCAGLPREWQGRCAASVASRFIETDWGNIGTAAAWCHDQTDQTVQAACYDELVSYSTFNFHSGSAEQQALCDALPQPWSASCFKKSAP